MVIYSKKKENLTEEEEAEGLKDAEIAKNQGDRWTFVAVLPESSYIQTTHLGEPTLEQAEVFIDKVKSKSDGQAPYYCSDCWFYEQALINNYCTWEDVLYKGKGRHSIWRKFALALLPKQVLFGGYMMFSDARFGRVSLLDIS